MSYTNNAIQLESLPNAADVTLKRVHPDYLRVLQITWGIALLIVLAITATIFIFVDNLHKLWLMGVVAGVYLLLVLLVMRLVSLSFRIRQYAVREKDVLYKTGWLIQRFHLVPFNRMQHCVVHAGPIDRRYGLASLSLYTAASEGKDITIHGLPLADAEKLKELIIAQIQPLEHEG